MMVRVPTAAVLMLFAIGTLGCGTGVSYAPREQPPHPFTFVKAGMTEQDVITVLGEPPTKRVPIQYPNDPIKAANNEVLLKWDTPKLGKIDVLLRAGLVHTKMKK